MELDQKDLMNEYISKQNKMIGELVNKNLMLESQLAVAYKMIEGLKERAEKQDDTGYKIQENKQDIK